MTKEEYEKELKALAKQLAKGLITNEEYWSAANLAKREYERDNQQEQTHREDADND